MDDRHQGMGDGLEGEEQDQPEPSSSPSHESEALDNLSSFREQWHKELKSGPEQVPHHQAPRRDNSQKLEDLEETVEEKARSMFLKGVQHEQDGKLYEAVKFYRQAVQLVPDIEFRLYEASKARAQQAQPVEVNLESLSLEETAAEPASVDEEDDMMIRLQRLYMKNPIICQPDQPINGAHISSLPMEIILYIMKWVVSSEMDLRVLEQSCSAVSRGFYLAARDPEIWRLACIRIWGVHCGGLSNFDSWRQMYIQRPHIHFHGCYISKTSYLRAGENSFQDQFYQPWHVVEYFRYLRFFSEGSVLMLTTPDDPSISLKELKHRQPRNSSVLHGHFRLHDDHVIIVLKRQADKTSGNNNKNRSKKRRDSTLWSEPSEQTFHLELQITSSRSHHHSQLQWQQYSIVTRRGATESTTNFDLIGGRFRPFHFSRVKSYTTESENVFQ
ncbi:F-box only protein 9 isoform X2 [Thrips palmi]|nr:F-box only protein 9 isoform X2 [Thrips palmi]XP_034250569.1 F-box only protein 9 isoform X2 [Thrips palmi]